MEFGIEKYAMLVMKSDKRHMTDGRVRVRDKIRMLGEEETYKYLGILEADTIKQVGMKDKIRKQKWKKKQLYGRLKRLINNISHQKTLTWLRKGNLKKVTESLLIAAQDNAIRTNHIKARIDKSQQNSKCRLCGNRDKTINHIISEYSKLAQKEHKARHDWVGKMIHWQMCKKFQFDHTNKWYMHNPAPVLENDTHKLYGTLTYKRIS